MSDVRRKQQAKVLIYESNPERGAFVCDKLYDHGIEASFVENAENLKKSLKNHHFDVVYIGDTFQQSEDLLKLCQEIRIAFPRFPEIVICTDNTKVKLHDCHQANVAALLKKNTDFSEICDLFERLAEVSGKRLYDGTQIRIANKLGKISGLISSKTSSHQIDISVSEIGRGGFYYEFDQQTGQKFVEGSVLNFNLKLAMFPDYIFSGKGLISWTRKLEDGRTAVGVEFVSIPTESESLIHAFVDLFKVNAFVPTKKSA